MCRQAESYLVRIGNLSDFSDGAPKVRWAERSGRKRDSISSRPRLPPCPPPMTMARDIHTRKPAFCLPACASPDLLAAVQREEGNDGMVLCAEWIEPGAGGGRRAAKLAPAERHHGGDAGMDAGHGRVGAVRAN